jgi:hypothetical protein
MKVNRRLVAYFTLLQCEFSCYAVSPGYGAVPRMSSTDRVRWFHWGPIEIMIE